jgi:hypothetical protein
MEAVLKGITFKNFYKIPVARITVESVTFSNFFLLSLHF